VACSDLFVDVPMLSQIVFDLGNDGNQCLPNLPKQFTDNQNDLEKQGIMRGTGDPVVEFILGFQIALPVSEGGSHQMYLVPDLFDFFRCRSGSRQACQLSFNRDSKTENIFQADL